MGKDNTCSTARYAYERRYLVNTFGGDEHVRITLWQTTEHMDSWHPISEHTFITGRLTANIGDHIADAIIRRWIRKYSALPL